MFHSCNDRRRLERGEAECPNSVLTYDADRVTMFRNYGITRNAGNERRKGNWMVKPEEEREDSLPEEGPADFISGVREAVNRALSKRENVVMVRVSDEALHYLDMLVEAGITKSRSESAAFLVNEGIKASSQLFERIEEIIDQITALRQQLSAIVAEETSLEI
jgi:hypothetical protein